jgi:hypothetical protein
MTIGLPPMQIESCQAMNVRAAWKASHRLRMLDQSDGSVSIVHRAMAAAQAD